MTQVDEHPSRFFVFPSSHFSDPSRLPLPQRETELLLLLLLLTVVG